MDTPIEKTHTDKMDKLINLNPVGKIESFGSSINSTLSVHIVEDSIKLFTFVKRFSVIPYSTTKDFEVIFFSY